MRWGHVDIAALKHKQMRQKKAREHSEWDILALVYIWHTHPQLRGKKSIGLAKQNFKNTYSVFTKIIL